MEKSITDRTLPTTSVDDINSNGGNKVSHTRRKLAWALIPLALIYLTFFHATPRTRWTNSPVLNYTAQCVQPDALFPKDTPELSKAFDFISSDAFRNASIERLSGAVKIKTETFDDLGAIGEDKRWEVFYGFHDYLEKIFPLVHEKLKVEKVNTHGLLFTWQGSNPDLKPTTLLAHQDTVPVPVDTVSTPSRHLNREETM